MAAERPPHAFAPDFRVGDWLVEPSLDRLSRNGTVLRLRPQLTNLLVLLAEHAGKTVSKDEILARVWEGQFVAESGMTRCIAELRQALCDDAREPKVLETIPKRGYRLVAPVVFLEPAPAPTAPPGAERTVEPPSILVSPTPEQPATNVDAEGAGPGEPGAPPRTPDSPLADARTRATSFRHALRVPLSAFVLVGLAWGVFGWTPAPVLGERDTVMLADFRNATGDTTFDQTLRLALAVQLGQAPFLHILPGENVRAALAMMGRRHDEPVVGQTALEVCRREGAAVVISGSIARLGAHYAVGLEATACRTGESVGREMLEVGGKDEVLSALGTGAARLRRRLGESHASLRQYDVPIVRATTPSLDALRALSLGDYNRDHARLPDALSFYRRATELDPDFAAAWARRGVAARNLEQWAAEERFGGVSEPMYCFRRAYELRERVSEPERFYIEAHYYRFVEGNLDKAADTYRVWRRTYPAAVMPTVNLASLYETFGRYDEALPLAREAVRVEPYSSIATTVLVVAYLGTNQVPEAKHALRRAAERGGEDALWHELAYQIAFADGDEAAMQATERWASRDASATASITSFRALAAASSGRLRESRRLWNEAAAAAAHGAGSFGQAGTKLLEAETEALVGNRKAARAAAEAALAIDREPGSLLGAAIVFAMGGDGARASSLIGEAARQPETTICTRFIWRPVARALVEAGSGRHDEALAALRDAAPFERSRDFGLAPLGLRGSIELSAGRPKEAAATFTELLNLRAVAPLSPWVAFARVGLARALCQSGDVAASRAAYDAAIASMKDADADAPLLVEARRERTALESNTGVN